MNQTKSDAPTDHVIDRASASGPELMSEIAALAALWLREPVGSREGYRTGLEWHPAGVLLEQLLADLTVVYSPPKVGGTTITATLNAHPAVRPEATHLHYLSESGLAALESQIAQCSHPNVRFFREHLSQCRGVRALLAANRALRARVTNSVVRKPYLIAGVREPVALYLSLAFEGWWVASDRPEAVSAEVVRDGVRGGQAASVCDDWFTNELEAVFGINVFAGPFPADRGWDLYENDAARVLVIRQENLDRLPAALGALYKLGPSDFVVRTCNVGGVKDYAEHYAAVKRALRLTRSELDRVYDTRVVRHFYTSQEIARFRDRWSAERRGDENVPVSAPPEPAAPVPAGPASEPASPPHVSVCRPCLICQQQLRSIPGLRHGCVTRDDRIRQLEAECRAAQHSALRPGVLRSLAQWLPAPVRALARRALGRSG